MPKLINSTEELREYLPVSVSLNFEDVAPKLAMVEREVIQRKVGMPIYAHLLENNTEPQEANLHGLLSEATAHLGLMHYLGFGHAQINSAGIQIVTDENHKTAFEWQVEGLRDECSRQGWSALESALEYLDNLPTQDPGTLRTLWEVTDTYLDAQKTLISTLRQFQQWVHLGESRVLFHKLIPSLRYVEEERIVPAIGQAMYDLILGRQSETDPAQKSRLSRLYRHCARAMAFATVAEGFEDTMLVLSDNGPLIIDAIQSRLTKAKSTASEEMVARMAKAYKQKAAGAITDMLAFCQKNTDHFPEYALSENYIPEGEDRTDHIPRNDPDAGIAFF